MTIALGIDTGGTYTDAALVDHDSGTVLARAKALTTRHDLSIGIATAIAAAFGELAHAGSDITPAQVGLVALSTTLATNAIVEGQGSPVCLLLVGYDPQLVQQYGFEADLPTREVVYLRGGHDGAGNEVEPLDQVAVRAAILAYRERVEAFAVSGYFGVRNPTHELRVRQLVEELTADAPGGPLPVTCGHELTTRLNAVRRAATTALNARLIPLLRELTATVRQTLDGMGIHAPLMVVKGDGSLVCAQWAMHRPIETILSGPAASVVGAWHLAGRRDAWVVDVGGTTTDIAALYAGRPRLDPEGAQVGRWRTMVEAVAVHTVGLGGDSLVRLDNEGALQIGPRRVVPLCMLASDYPRVVGALRARSDPRHGGPRNVALTEQQRAPRGSRYNLDGQFVLSRAALAAGSGASGGAGWPAPPGLAEEDGDLLRQLDGGPQLLDAVLNAQPYGALVLRRIEELEGRRLLLRAGFTPTDALHVLGRFVRWDAEASRLGAELLAARAGLTVEAFCEQVVEGVAERVSTELVSAVLSEEASAPEWSAEPAAAALLARALGRLPASDLECLLRLRRPVVAIGAPVEAYLPQTASQLSTELVIPPCADVANAVGAVAGSVVLQRRVIVRPLGAEQGLRLHLSDGVHDTATLEEAVAYAEQVVPQELTAAARQAGAEQVEVRSARIDRSAPVGGGWGDRLFIETELTYTAVGRPGMG